MISVYCLMKKDNNIVKILSSIINPLFRGQMQYIYYLKLKKKLSNKGYRVLETLSCIIRPN